MKSIATMLLAAITMSASANTYINNNNAEKAPEANAAKEALNDTTKDSHFICAKDLNEVVVSGMTGETKLKYSPTPISLMTAEQLRTTSAPNIIDAIAKLPGLSQITTGSGISKPIIRGLGYNRVVVVKDGVRQEGQQWGDEHGVEIDPQSVGSVEVLKGPASLRYGSDAMAGVVVFHNNATQPENTMKTEAGAEYQTNNGLFAYSINNAGNKNGWLWDWRYSYKLAHAYKNKYDGYVLNTQFKERAVSGMIGKNANWGHSHLNLSYYHLTPAISEGERDEQTGQFVTEDDIATKDQLKTYGFNLPFQQIKHYKAVFDQLLYLGNGSLKATVGYQQNRRQEFEESSSEPGLDMRLQTVSYDINYTLPMAGGWRTIYGIGGMYQKNDNLGEEMLIPTYNLFDLGVFATANKQIGKWNLSGGLRFDNRHFSSKNMEDHFASISKDFNGVTGSIGAVYDMNKHFNIKANIARGFRAPNASELASNGHHEGSLRYELGNAGLKAENSWQIDLGIDYTSTYVDAQLSVFANRVNNYIFIQKLGNTIIDDVPAYQYIGGDAQLFGGEATVEVHPLNRLHVINSFSYVNAKQLHQTADHEYLPMTPMPRYTFDVHYDIINDGKTLSDLYVSAQMECYMKQNYYLKAYDTETATTGYGLLNATIGATLKAGKRKVADIYITGSNLLNKAYQNHLSRLKYADMNNATGRSGIYEMGRNICFKVVIPFTAKI